MTKLGQILLGVLLVVVLALTLTVATAGPAAAAPRGTVLFAQGFANNTPNGTGAVALPLGVNNGANSACLTATGSPLTGVLLSCPASTTGAPTVNDTPGSGALSLTSLQNTKTGGLFAATSVPTVQGLDLAFTLNQYGGGGADGIAFVLSAVNPAAPVPPPNMGPSGGSLGYSAFSNSKGLSNGYLGFGFDAFGNFSTTTYQGTGCATSTYQNGTTKVPGQVLIRGPGNNTTGYCPLNGTGANAATTAPPVIALRKTTRANSAVPVRIIINPSTAAITPAAGLTTAAQSYLLAFTPIGGAQQTLTGLLPAMSTSLVGASTWLDANGLPKQLAFGWVGSTGSVTDNHEVSNVTVSSINTVTKLTVGQVNYSPAAATTTTPLPAGSPIGYVVTPGVAAGLPENGTITVTETVPAGVVPLSATGTDWVCGAPSGQTISCTNSAGPFAAGSSLPTITVSAVVTGSTVTQTTLQTSSVVTASSDLSDPAYSSSSTTGTNPTAPAVTAVSPTSGLVGGGTAMTITGTDLAAATSIQIGTAAEMAAGTASTLTPCATVAAPGCFTVSSGTLVISSLPGHAVGTVIVRVANLGAYGDGAYSYISVPGTPVVTAVPGITSATVSWSGTDGGSAITGYTVTPFQGVNAQTSVPVAAGTTSKVFSGLIAGSSYTFQVTATNANGTSPVGTSPAVTPYNLPTAPRSPTVAASTGQAIVSWTAPTTNNGSAITGYTVTPYLGAAAQTPQVFASTALTQTVTGLTAGSSYTFRVAATNAAGTGPESPKTSAVTINALPTLAVPTPVAGEVGAPYSNAGFSATGGTGPFSWSIQSGSLPTGLALSTAGVISGTPTASGTASFTVKVSDAAGQTATQALTLAVAPAPVLANPVPPGGQVGVAYSNQLSVQTGTGTGPFSWSVTGGSLPPGLSINASTGVLSGTPTASGTSPFTVQVTDAFAQTATQTLSITVTPSPSLSFPAPPAGQVAAPYSRQLVVTGGTGPYTWSTTGTLPPGLTLDTSTGLLSGIPTTAGPYPFVVGVQDSTGQSATQPVTLTIAASPTVTFTPSAGEVGRLYTAAPVLSGGTGPYSYAISAGTLPPGLTLNTTTGAITGTPTTAGSSGVTVRVTDAFSQTATANGTVVIVPAPTLTLPAPPVGDVGAAYSDQLTVNGGSAPFVWSISSGTLQAGLTLNASTGLLSGTPTAGGSATVTVTVVDGFGGTDSQQLTVLIRLASTVALASSLTSTTPGGSVLLTATVAPGNATGSVAFTDTITSGPEAGTSIPLGSTAVTAGGTAAITVPLASFGSHHIMAAYSGDGTQSAASSAAKVVEVVATPGSVLVSEFRLSGPAGPADQYVELSNVSAVPVALAGFQVASSSGTVTTLPAAAPPLLPGRAYLLAGSDFSLGAIAHPDTTVGGGLGSGGLSVRAPDSASTQTDAVGPNVAGYHLGTALPAVTGTPTAEFGWVRTQSRGYVRNTQDNAADFALVSTSGGAVGGVASMLGSPSPTGLADPWRTFVVRSALLNPAVAASANPNRITVRVLPGVPGSIIVRRALTNTTSETVTAMRIRLQSLSETNGLNLAEVPGPIASLRAVNPPTQQSTVVVTGTPVTVQNLSLDQPANATPGGGLNSTYTVPLPPGGLPAGGTVSVSFSFAADTSGTWWFGYDVDTLAAS